MELTSVRPGINNDEEIPNDATVDANSGSSRRWGSKGDDSNNNNKHIICEGPIQPKPLLCRILLYYFAPISTELGLSFCCIFYHFFNSIFTLGLFIYSAIVLPLSVSMMVIACIGLVFLWIVFEVALFLARIDLGTVYYVVERDSELLRARGHLLTLSVFTRNMPICCWYSASSQNFMAVIIARAKYLFLSADMWCIVIYQVFVKPLLVLFCSWTCIVSVYVMFCMVIPLVWYVAGGDKDNGGPQTCPYGGSECDSNDENCTCYGWAMRDLGDVMGVTIASLFLLPIILRLNNWTASFLKMAAYYFLTYYYTNDEDRFHDTQTLLTGANTRSTKGRTATAAAGDKTAVTSAVEKPCIEEWNQL